MFKIKIDKLTKQTTVQTEKLDDHKLPHLEKFDRRTEMIALMREIGMNIMAKKKESEIKLESLVGNKYEKSDIKKIEEGIINLLRKKAIGGWSIAKIHRCALEYWCDDVPYGVLLKIKEAKDIGFNDFIVHYPVIKHKESDPIITAMFGLAQYVIVKWDNGKIYD